MASKSTKILIGASALVLTGALALWLNKGSRIFLTSLLSLALGVSETETQASAPKHLAGFFELAEPIKESFAGIEVVKQNNALVGIAPHHLPTALNFISAFYKNLAAVGTRQTIVVLGPDHFRRCRANVSVGQKAWQTAFGPLEADQELIEKIIASGSASLDDDCFDGEHAIGVQANFIKYLFPESKIVPLLFSAETEAAEIDRTADYLFFIQDEVTIIASLDFSHYRSRSDAERFDQQTLRMIKDLDVETVNWDHVDSPAVLKIVIALARKTGLAARVLGQASSVDFNGEPGSTTSYFNVIFERIQ